MTEVHRNYVEHPALQDNELEPGEIAPAEDRETKSHRRNELRDKRRQRRSHSPSRHRDRRLHDREEQMHVHPRSPATKQRHRREVRHRDKRAKKEKRRRSELTLQQQEDDSMDIDEEVVIETWTHPSEAEDIEKQREERKKRIEAIKNKYRAQQLQQQSAAVQLQDEAQSTGSSTVDGQCKLLSSQEAPPARGMSPDSVSSAECAFEARDAAMKETPQRPSEVETDEHLKSTQSMERTDCSADRCDILIDEKYDKERLLNRPHDDQTSKQSNQDDPVVDDIFCETPDAGNNKTYQGLDNAVKKAAANRGLMDAYDDAEGYYKFTIGEIMDSRYEVLSCKGKGVFSTVLCGRDKVRKDETGEYPEVCIKVIRANDLMKNCGKREEQFLKLLSSTDPENKRHCIRLLRSFAYRGHLCLVFEPMAMNLRELTKKFGRNLGLSLDGVGHFTAQLLVALKHLKINKILHADIKPDNILVNEKNSRVKLCDFGSAMEDWSTEITPYVCSRFYRPPEVVLGLKYSYGMDMWSLGCVIYEMFTGQYLFPGRTNNAMLKLMMDVKGPFSKKLLKKAAFCDDHFEKDANMSFIEVDVDKFTKKPTTRLISNPTVKHNFHTLLNKYAEGCNARLVAQLADLLEKMMMLDPEKRIDVDEAIRHPFIRAFIHRAKSAQQQNVQEHTEAAATVT